MNEWMKEQVNHNVEVKMIRHTFTIITFVLYYFEMLDLWYMYRYTKRDEQWI